MRIKGIRGQKRNKDLRGHCWRKGIIRGREKHTFLAHTHGIRVSCRRLMLYGSDYIVGWEKKTADVLLCHLLWFFPTSRSTVLFYLLHPCLPGGTGFGPLAQKQIRFWRRLVSSGLQNQGCDLEEPLYLVSRDLTDRSSSSTLTETERPTDQVTFYRTTREPCDACCPHIRC